MTRGSHKRTMLLLGVGLALALVTGPAGAAYWWPTQGAWLETAHLAPDDAHEGGEIGHPSHWGINFGAALDLDGETLVVGTQMTIFNDGWKTTSGDGGDWAYVFERQADGSWLQTAKLIPDDAHEGDTFAYSVAVDHEAGIIVAGNPGYNEKTDRIYIFERDADGSWGQTATFHRESSPPGLFGLRVAVDDHRVLSGIHPELYIFEKLDGVWQETTTLEGIGHVAIEGNRMVTGVFNESSGFNEFQVYDHDGEAWQPVARVDPSGPHNRTNTVGCNVDLSEDGEAFVIGACIDRRVYGVHTEHTFEFPAIADGEENYVRLNGAGAVGSVWVYEETPDGWELAADIPNPDPGPDSDLFGYRTAISEGMIVVGSPWNIYNGASVASGGAYIYEKQGGEWLLQAKLRNHDNGPYGGGDSFGRSVGISDGVVAIGAPRDDQRRDGTPPPLDDDGDSPYCIVLPCDEGEDAGSVYVFERLDDLVDPPSSRLVGT